MKRMSWVMMGIGLLLLFAGTAHAVPVDLHTFDVFPTAPAGLVTVSGAENNGATIKDDDTPDPTLRAVAVGLYNDFFAVGTGDVALTFGYEVGLDGASPPDTFVFTVRNSADLMETFFLQSLADSGSFSFDLTPYRGSAISLEWALMWGGDELDPAKSWATLSDVEVSGRADPVPEPGTLLLLGSGLLGLAGRARRRKS